MPTLKPLEADEFDYWKAHHLLNRAGFGGTPGQVRALANLGLDDAVDYLVQYREVEAPAVDPEDFDSDIMTPPTPDERARLRNARRAGDEETLAELRRRRQMRQRADRRQIRELKSWWLTRLLQSPRPLQEKMVLFWHGHFATSYRGVEDSYHLFRQNQLFRAQAVGNFKALTHGIVKDPAMLRYLNNNQNRRQAPNENLARELMELFTLGEGHVYTEQDIKEGARALTGYSYDDDSFVFRRRQHDDGMKRILGRSGRFDGDDFVDIILRQNAASEFICWKLYRFFVNDVPGGAPDPETVKVVRRMAAELRRADWELAPVLTMLFRSEHFYAPANVASQIKSPAQLVVQAVRSLRTPVRSDEALLASLQLMGQDLFFPPSVKGWSGGRAWINTSTLFVRQNLVVYLLTGRTPRGYRWQASGETYDAMHLVEHLGEGGTPATRDVVTYLLRFNLGRDPDPQRVTTLVRFVEDHGGRIDNDMVIALVALIAAMPEYQLC